MGREKDSISQESFLKRLRSDLNHLYDADHLRQSPLLELFDLSSRFDAPFALQNALIAAIEELRPAKSDPAAEQYRRLYELLHIRYVQQSGQDEVATQFGISIRQVRREQQAALEFLGARLWNQFSPDREKSTGAAPARQTEKSTDAQQLDSERELAWLKEDGAESPADLSLLLPQVIELVEPFARQSGAEICLDADMALPLLSVHWVALRQALINLITLAIQVTSQKRVEISSQVTGDMVVIQIRCQTGGVIGYRIEEQQTSLEMIRKMVEVFDGQLTLETDHALFQAHLILPMLLPVKVLVIDDNADFSQLMQRYTESTRYQLSGLQDPTGALQAVEQFQPEIIILDVMMPRIDGWQILHDLKKNPTTATIAVVVCTIFAQKDLAFSLGADDFAQKPITQESLLAALDRQTARLGKTGQPTSARSQSDR